MATTVWYNKNFSGVAGLLDAVRDAAAGQDWRLVASHTHDDVPACAAADHFEVEPRGLTGAPYVEFCLDFVRRHAIDVFVPGKEAGPVTRERHRFAEAGCRLVVAADADTLALLDDKEATYAAAAQPPVAVPPHEVVVDLAGFDAAYARLRERHAAVCFKPVKSVYGRGFRVVVENGSPLDRLLDGDLTRIGIDDARRWFGSQPRFRRLMVMPYLPGPERSVDCLAAGGELAACVSRRKPSEGGAQWLEDGGPVLDAVRWLTRRFELDAVYNVQFRDMDGVPYLLEINPRMSGGLNAACLSGVAFPYWAVRLALGTATPADVPRPRTGLRVAQVNRAVLV
jgi:hypothetical protein